mmetsp:Transcript_2998/g.4525  ORF Transcript_2998/g.4525 Transcript_2998/m.4525 type:complete len:377 (-) Transcript_2998:53-1183(-)
MKVHRSNKYFVILCMINGVALFQMVFIYCRFLQSPVAVQPSSNTLYLGVQKSTTYLGVQTNTTSKAPSCKCVDCREDEICGGLWKGKRYPFDHTRILNATVNEYVRKKKIHVVISHCVHDLKWVRDFIKGFRLESIHVVSKCGKPVQGALFPAQATIEHRPNVGRCDHTYAHYITTVMSRKIKKGEEKDSIVAFLKDDISEENRHNGGNWVKFGDLLRAASSENGFGCGCLPRRKVSTYADKHRLFRFKMDNYVQDMHVSKGYNTSNFEFKGKFVDVGDFYSALPGLETPPDIVQVCYGGIFAASVSNIKKRDKAVWKKLRSLLSRGDNIQEGHYAERSWAILLSKPLQPFQVEALQNYKTRYMPRAFGGSLAHQH